MGVIAPGEKKRIKLKVKVKVKFTYNRPRSSRGGVEV